MKRFKKILVNVLATLLLVVGCFGLSACKEDIVKVKLNVSVYNYAEEDGAVIGEQNLTLTVDLYRHVAKNTVNKMIGYINDGYYNNAVFYELESYPNQIMLGDLVVKGTAGAPELNEIKPQISGEFEKGGVSGSNLVAKKGSIGLWRTWTAYDNSYNESNQTMHSGRATWFLPTNTASSTLSGYNGWFCIFAQFSLTGDNEKAFELIQKALEENTTEYVVYYTGEYKENAPDENDGHGLEYHIVEADDFKEDEIEGLFEAKDAQQVCYNHHKVSVPTLASTGAVTAKITSAKVV